MQERKKTHRLTGSHGWEQAEKIPEEAEAGAGAETEAAQKT